MHYKSGEPAAVGHIVKGPHYTPGAETLGLVVSTVAGTDTCNLNVVPLATIYNDGQTRTVIPGRGRQLHVQHHRRPVRARRVVPFRAAGANEPAARASRFAAHP